MAEIKSVGTVDVTLTVAELELIRRGLRLVKTFGDSEDFDPAADLLADLSVMPS
jgi:hypothetical protein